MLIDSNHQKPQASLEVQLSGVSIEQVRSCKFLGVMLNDTLTWSDHVNLICTKASKGIDLLRRIAWFLPKEALLCHYNAYILPHFTYADIVWNTCTASESARLERLQNYAVRIILQRHWEASATCIRKEMGWHTLASRRMLSEVVTTFHSISGHSPHYLSSLLRPVVSLHNHGTRSVTTNGLHLPKVSTGFGKKSFAFRVAQRWNSLPPELRQIKHHGSFLPVARTHLLSH